MTQSCANPGCTANGTKTCARCRQSSYCSKLCQKENWAQHKLSCKPISEPASADSNGESKDKTEQQIQCVKIYGQGDGGGRYEDIRLPSSHPVFATTPLPVSIRFGYPLVMKRLISNLPRGRETDNQHATWLMIDPVSGFAPPQWQGGIGSVYVARPDRQPLTSATLAGITDYVSDILDTFGGNIAGPAVRAYYNRAKLDRFLVQHRKMQMDYQAALHDPRVVAEAAQWAS